MRKLVMVTLGVSMMGLPIAASAKDKEPKPVELSESELATLQKREISAGTDVVFRSSISALQEMSYVNINASKDAGTITAETDAKSKLVYNIFWGFGKKKLTQVASVFVEPVSPTLTRISVKLQTVEAKARMGSSYSDGKPVVFGEPYKAFYAEFDKALAVRMAEAAAPAAPVPAAAEAVAAPAPVATPVAAASEPTG
ncbi:MULTISPECIES: hypothetical protein [unclassified Sphingopyxis]|uniref:hypothetical protein n=1 Tax=unclassified Sphingopyxis TaxID=2614943 RepID=UPI00285DBAFE|nr:MULTISPECIES: hypothetical protein [unclassified Sphingopyxis]MDR6834584.1 hypothetical protein [Sphingopyxis sp. BE122]MDR7226854.1 hypothetical protein [Sphingopyxis sp. BE259]